MRFQNKMTNKNYRPRTNCISYLFKPKSEDSEEREPTEEELEREVQEKLDTIRKYDGYGMYKGEQDGMSGQ